MANERLTGRLAQRLSALRPEQRALLEKMRRAHTSENGAAPAVSGPDIVALPRVPTAHGVYEFPASFSQQRLWLLDQLSPQVALYTIPLIVPMHGQVRRTALEGAINEIVDRHEALRTTFAQRDAEIVQLVRSVMPVTVRATDLSRVAKERRAAATQKAIDAELAERFDLHGGPLVRAHLIILAPLESLLVVCLHHIVFDGWSAGLFLRELQPAYDRHFKGAASGAVAAPLIQYADYAVWQRQWAVSAAAHSQRQYWKAHLAGLSPVMLPLSRSRPAVPSFMGSLVSEIVDSELTRSLRLFGHKHGATLFMTLIAAWGVLIHRYSGQEDLGIGTYVLGRNRTSLEALIGCFLNTLVMRLRLSGGMSFLDCLAQSKRVSLEAFARQDVPFELVVQDLDWDRGAPPLNLTFQYLNVPTLPTAGEHDAPAAQAAVPSTEAVSFDLAVTVADRNDELLVQALFSHDLFDAADIERMLQHYLRLLELAITHAEVPIGDLDLLDERERHQAIRAWNDTHREEPHTSLSAMFDLQAARTPEGTAFIGADGTISYRELAQRINRLCNHLVSIGAGPGSRIGVLLERSIDAIVAVLTAFRLHALYIPLDASYPDERLQQIASGAQLELLITRRALADRLMAENQRTIVLDDDAPRIAAAAADFPALPAEARGPAYVLYTSGSTGRPKGVVGHEGQIVNRLQWMWHEYPFSADEVACHKTALGFIDSLWEIFGAMLKGTPTVILGNEVLRDPAVLLQDLRRHGVTRIWLVPSLLQLLTDTYPDLANRVPKLRFWVSSGEALGPELQRRFNLIFPEATLYNLYGTSEFWDATWYVPGDSPAEGVSSVPIGRPIWNMRAYVLDARGAAQPPGVPGELYVAGAGVALGYLNQPELTSERFLPDPLHQGSTMYRTGDLARWRADGQLEYVGRVDRQTKVRGYRVELQEIESAVAACPGTGNVAVVATDGEHGTTLVAYVAAAGGALEAQRNLAVRVRQHLRRQLPDYMVPSRIVIERELPLTPTGKIDRVALAARAGETESARPLLSPRTPVEASIATIWTEVLGRGQVGVDEDFFDLGGHSLSAMRVISRINEAFAMEMPVSAFFDSPTVAGLAECVARSAAVESSP